MNFAHNAPFTPLTKLGGRNILRRLKWGSRLEMGAQAQRLGHALVNCLVERAPPEPTHCETEQDQTNITVHHALPGGVREKCMKCHLSCGFSIGLIFERAPGG